MPPQETEPVPTPQLEGPGDIVGCEPTLSLGREVLFPHARRSNHSWRPSRMAASTSALPPATTDVPRSVVHGPMPKHATLGHEVLVPRGKDVDNPDNSTLFNEHFLIFFLKSA